ncbi:hypothetical protein ACFSMW_13410 [Virgibacillus halophilus]|uniref:Uncharacterized protein n=1 Tax=Tigheibacillus halophilus TaxID=361280 RepID=A0ABU5C7W2_9BACI|nr:hypothetical protein [Virgibacillus halophilus]
MNDLPDKVIGLDQIRINRGLEKICKCEKRKFMIDTKNRRITCQSCGAVVDPYEAMYELAMNGERLQEQVENLLEQRKQIADYKPWLVTIKKLEKQYRGRKMLPCCPRCSEPFYLEELTTWNGKQFADAKIKKWRAAHEKEG